LSSGVEVPTNQATADGALDQDVLTRAVAPLGFLSACLRRVYLRGAGLKLSDLAAMASENDSRT
jgi:hypothetical protein